MRLPKYLLAACFVAISGSAFAQVDTQTARDFYERGLLRENAGEFPQALADFRKAGELDPSLFDAHFSLSGLHAEMKNYPEAIEALAAALRARPKDYSALLNSGSYSERLRKYDDALAFYTQAAAEDADFSHYGDTKEQARASAYHYRGRIYQWHKKDNLQAVADYTTALRLAPEMRMVQYRRACAYHDLKEFDKAHQDFTAAYRLDPEYANLLNAFAWQLATCPDPTCRDGQLALEMATKGGEVETVAAAYAEFGDFSSAVAYQRRAIRSLDRSPEPDDEQAAERRQSQRERMLDRLALYLAERPYRDDQ